MRWRPDLEAAGLHPLPGCLMGPGQPLRSAAALTAAMLQLLRGASALSGLLGASCCCTSMPPARSGCGGPCPTPLQPCWAARGCGTRPMLAALCRWQETGPTGSGVRQPGAPCSGWPQDLQFSRSPRRPAAGCGLADGSRSCVAGLVFAGAAKSSCRYLSAGCDPLPAAGAVPHSCCLLLLSWSSGGCW